MNESWGQVTVEPNLSDFESWPHPIVQLVLRNFRFSEKPKAEEKAKEQTETVDPKTGNVHLAIPVAGMITLAFSDQV